MAVKKIVPGCLNKAVDNSAEISRGEGESPTPQTNLKSKSFHPFFSAEGAREGALSCNHPKILHLTLRKKWFDLILSGEKKTEYRAITPYWSSRLYYPRSCKRRGYDFIQFRNGYNKNSPMMHVEYKGFFVSVANFRYEIQLGKVICTQNVK